MEKLKVIFHINENEKWPVVLSNVKNLIKDMGEENIIVKVIANGVAVAGYMPEPDNQRVIRNVEELSKIGVRFIACRNSLVGNKIDEETLSDTIKIVPAGVTELVKRQSEGYAYIKP